MQRNASKRSGRDAAGGSTLLLLFGGVFLGALDVAIVGPALPAIQGQLGLDSRQAAAIVTVYILFGLIGSPFLAALSDRWGRRRVYVGCLLLFGLGSIVVATSASLRILLVGRAIQAVGAGGTLPVASAVVADTYPVEHRGRALGLIGAVFGLAFALGPLIGGIFLRWSWRWLFVVNLPLIVVLVAMSIVRLEDTARERTHGFDAPGAVLLAVGLAGLAYGASHLRVMGVRVLGLSPYVLGAFAVAAVALACFWLAERRAHAPILDPRLLESRQMRIIGVLGLATGLVEASMIYLPTLAVSALEVSSSRASFMLLPLILSLIAGSVVAGRVLDRIGSRPVIQVGMACTMLGLLLFGLLPLDTTSFYAAGLAVGFGLSSLLGAPLRYAALDEGGERQRGASQGLLTVSLSTGRLFGASLTGGIAAVSAVAATGYREAMLVFAVACGIALVASIWLRNAVSAPRASAAH